MHTVFDVHPTPAKRAYIPGFKLRKVPRLVSTTPTRAEVVYYQAIVAELTAARRRLGISQPELSQRIGVSDAMVAKWESGMKLPSAFYLMCWASALSVRLIHAPEVEGDHD